MKKRIGPLSPEVAAAAPTLSICRGCQSEVENGVCPACLLAVGIADDVSEAAELDFSDIPEGNWRLGGYELLEEIGRGGMGVIYRARQPLSNRLVALKRLLPQHGATAQTARRLRAEAEAVASLDHPNIMPIYEVAAGEDGLPFFSMKLAAGGSLAQSGERLRSDPKAIAGLMVKVCRAVQYAHGRQILHRDLKPDNILLDGQGEPLVADFGLAKWIDRPSEMTLSLTVFGTPGYLAPEQASGPASELTAAADIYSLGAILFDLLAGRPPFIGGNAWIVVRRATAEKAPLLRTLVPGADRDLETICARCLEREPSARYRNAGDIADDLQRWLDGRSIIARPVSLPETTWRWVRRNRLLTTAGVLCLSLGALGLWHLAESRRLSAQVLAQEQASLAVRLLPIFDMDAASTVSREATDIFSSATRRLREAGRNSRYSDNEPAWSRDFASEAKLAHAPFLIAGITRQTPAGRRVALHWFDTREGRFTRRVIGVGEENLPRLTQYLLNELLEGRGQPVQEADAEFVANTQEARELVASGENYFSRFTVESLDQAISCGRKAIIADPQSPRAYTLLALSLKNRAWYGVDNQASFQAQADEAVKKAIALAPESPSVYQARASVAFLSGRLEEAREAIRGYGELSMDIATVAKMSGCIAKLYGRPDQALTWFRMCAPFAKNQDCLTLQADAYSDLDMDNEAALAYEHSANLFPDQPTGRLGLCELKLLNGNFIDAREMIELLEKDFPTQVYPRLIAAQEALYARDFPRAAKLYGALMETDRKGGDYFYGAISFLAGRGYALLKSGKTDEGRLLLEEARRNDLQRLKAERSQPDQLNSLAANQAALGNSQAALSILRENLDIMSVSHRFIERDPRFDAMRGDPQFQTLLRQMTQRLKSLKRQVEAENPPSNATSKN